MSGFAGDQQRGADGPPAAVARRASRRRAVGRSIRKVALFRDSFRQVYMSTLLPDLRDARAWHCTTRLAVDGVLVRTPSERRAAISAVLRHGRPAGLIAFCVVDTHLHAVFVGDRVRIGEAMRRLEIACHKLLKLRRRFEGARIRPVRDQAHLRSTVDYVLRQLERHEIRTDPLGESSAVHDLLGARVPGLFLPDRLLEELPRGNVGDPWRLVGVDRSIALTWDEPVRASELEAVAEATLRAFALRSVPRRGRRYTMVRAAMVHALDPQISAAAAGRALGLSRGAVLNLRSVTVPDAWVLAVRRQTRLGLHAVRALAGSAVRITSAS